MTIKYVKNTVVVILARTGFLLARLLPRPAGLRLFGALGRLVFLVPGTEKRRTIEHLRLIYSSWPEERVIETARGVYESLGKNLFDAVHLSRCSPRRFDRLVTHDDLGDFQNAYARGRGVIVITAHVGCFEMLLHFFARHGFKSFAVGKKSYDERLDRIIRDLRSGPGIEYMDRSESTRKIIRYLQEGRAFGVLIDQDTDIEGVFAPFLGRPAFTPSAPIRMAMRFHVPVVVATTVRKPDDTHHVLLSNIFEFDEWDNFDEALVRNVGIVNDLIGETIDRHPEQWVWMHRRWKTLPQMKTRIGGEHL